MLIFIIILNFNNIYKLYFYDATSVIIIQSSVWLLHSGPILKTSDIENKCMSEGITMDKFSPIARPYALFPCYWAERRSPHAFSKVASRQLQGFCRRISHLMIKNNKESRQLFSMSSWVALHEIIFLAIELLRLVWLKH